MQAFYYIYIREWELAIEVEVNEEGRCIKDFSKK